MVRLILFLFAILFFPLIIKGQVIVVEPLTFTLHGNPSQYDLKKKIHVTNISNETLNLYWSKRTRNEPSPWADYICDKTTCWDSSFLSNPANKPNVMPAGDTFNIEVHLLPFQREGTGDYELNLMDEDGNILATITGLFIIDQTTAVKDVSTSRLTVFPNPTTDFFEVSEAPGLRYVEIFNIVGNKVRSFDAVPQKQYYVGDLSDGIYLVRLTTASKKVLKTVRLSKR